MSIYNFLHNRLKAALILILVTAFAMPLAFACAETIDEGLGMYTGWQEQPVLMGRSPKPISQTAENVTVITADDIASLNAHTLADVLATVPGVQIDATGGHGSIAYTFVQSSQTNHVQILLDGVTVNNFSDNFADIAMIPAQIIERVEIIKGAASSAWGQALGGVINVITKSPDRRPVAGETAVSLGMRNTDDVRGELTGTVGKLGYYLSGGYLASSGFVTNTQVYSSNGYAKLTLDLPDNAKAWGTLAYSGAKRGDFAYSPIDSKGDDQVSYLMATLGLRKRLLEGVELELSGHHINRGFDVSTSQISDNTTLQKVNTREHVSGGGAKLSWRSASNLMVAGSEYEHADYNSTNSFLAYDRLDRTLERWGFYLNDTLTMGPVAVTGGVRLDLTASSDNQVSPSLGATWQIEESTVLRVYAGKGYSLPTLTLDRPAEKVWTVQTGFETSALPFVWFKGTLFRNELSDITVRSSAGIQLLERRIAMGAEAELRTVPLLNTYLTAGYTFTDTTRTSDGSQVLAAPRNTLQLALRYDDKKLLHGALLGRHIWWNSDPAYGGRYHAIIWDLFLGATVFKRGDTSLELFFSGRNLFNGSQYQDEVFRNPGRRYEGGIMVRF